MGQQPLQRTYHAGETTDLNRLVKWQHQPKSHHGFRLFLGGTPAEVVGEQGGEAGITAAATVSVPFDLSSCGDPHEPVLQGHKAFRRFARKHPRGETSSLPLYLMLILKRSVPGGI